MKTPTLRITLPLLLAATLASCDSSTSNRYVNASRLPLRAGASANANAVGYVNANQSVRLLSNKGEWCEVEGGEPPAHGYCLCKYLAATPMSMENITQQIAKGQSSPRERLDLESRAFWLEPSLQRWVKVGRALENTHLSHETLDKEMNQKKPLRFKVPEFDAMKQKLEQGIIAPPPTPSAVSNHDEPLAKARARATLPEIRPSFFAENEIFALPGQHFNLENSHYDGTALIDTLSGFNKTPFRVHFDRPAYYPAYDNFIGMTGVWDIGTLTARFDKLARLSGITLQGQATAIDIAAVSVDFDPKEHSCVGNHLTLDTRPIKQMPPWKDTLVAWVGKPAQANATVKTRHVAGEDPYDRLEIYDIDLNGDGVADFSIWNGVYAMPASAQDGFWQAVFVNVNGKWRLMAYDQDADCT